MDIKTHFRGFCLILMLVAASCGGSGVGSSGPQDPTSGGSGNTGKTPALASITISPSSPNVAAGATTQLVATAAFSDGTTLDITATVKWSSSDSGVATVGSTGLVTASVSGATTIRAEKDGITGDVTLTVTSTGGGRQPARIYATIVTHNERSPHLECDPVVTDRSAYLANRELTLELAHMVVGHGAAWDLQTDYMYLDAVKRWDTPQEMTLTAGRNLIQYLAELSPGQLVIDAHGHTASGPNYADISYLIGLMGAPRNGVVGGFIYYPSASQGWTQFESAINGRKYPDVTWTADILWGAATMNHLGPDSKASGVWRPKDSTHFHTDDPGRRLVNVGGYTSDTSGVEDLLSRLKAGRLQEGKIYTATIFLNQCSLTSRKIADLSSFIDAHAADVSRGLLVWATLPEIVHIWREEYESRPTIFLQDGFTPPY